VNCRRLRFARRVRTRLQRGLRAFACGLLVIGSISLWPSELRASGGYGWTCEGPCVAILLLGVAGTAVVSTADVYYTVRAYETPISPQLGRNAIYWTSWQAGLIDAIALGGLTSGRISESDGSMGMLALGAWPLSLTANGMWHAFPDSPRTRGWAVGMVTFSDVALLSYDALLLGNGRRAKGGLAFAEAFIGTLQLGFGLVTAARADREDRALVLSMTAIPAALTTYGVLALALPETMNKSSDRRVPTPNAFASLPHLGFAPLRGGMMMQAFGAF